MFKVKISTAFPEWPFLRQTHGSKGVWGNCSFFVDQEMDECDYWFVYGDCIKKESTLCPKSNIIFISGEPESVRNYSEAFLSQFGGVITCQRNIRHPNVIFDQQALPWLIGRRMKNNVNISFSKDYDELKSIQSMEKDKLMSVICSNKTFTEGHKKRLQFVLRLKEYFGDRLDVFGSGIRELEDKWDAIAPYKYHIALENSSYPDYWTEKLSDAYLGGAYPIYYGCLNIDRYFSPKAFTRIELDDFDRSVASIEQTLAGNLFERRQNELERAKRQVMDEYNLFSMIHKYCNEQGLQGTKEKVTIRPEFMFKFSRISLKARLKYALKRLK